MKKLRYILFFISICVNAQQLAFPTAIGAGAYSIGGRGGKVCHVDTLTWSTAVVYDATTDTYSGGFYNMFYELNIPAKQIVFDVAGTIVVPSPTELFFNGRGNITVNGQTAPGKIVFESDYFYMENFHDVVFRYLSFTTHGTFNAGGTDALWLKATTGNTLQNLIVDHCSFYYGTDECLDISGPAGSGNLTNVTVQNCLMGGAKKGMILGGLDGVSNTTMAYSAFIDCNYRFPNIQGNGTSQSDVYNIFSENYNFRLTRTTGSGNFNLLNNYTQSNYFPSSLQNRAQLFVGSEPSVHSSGNIVTGYHDTPTSPDFDSMWTIFEGSEDPPYTPTSLLPTISKVNTPMTLVGKAGTVYNAVDVPTVVLQDVGNNKRLGSDGNIINDSFVLDDFYIDLGVNPVTTNTGVRYPATKFPTVTGGTPYTDVDKDGMADTWEVATFGDLTRNGTLDLDSDGYTDLEEFLNLVDTPVKAFPTAYGAGAYTTGGRGGTVVHVTNLNDSGVGSFRYALQLTYPRIIVFDVSGVINLTSLLGGVGSNVTIAGQTAPAGGITIDGARVYFDGVDNVICRYIRFKGGVDETYPIATGNDSFSAVGSITNQIYDHCSFAFGADESASWYATNSGDIVDKLTVQRSLFAESKDGSIFGGKYGVVTSVGDISVLNNLWYNDSHRSPNVAGQLGARFDVVNNVAWTIKNRIIEGTGEFSLNQINNYYDYGVQSVIDTRLNPVGYFSGVSTDIYTNGNKIVATNTGTPLTYNIATMNADNQKSWKFFQTLGGYTAGDQVPSNYFNNTQFALLGEPITIQTADAAFADVKADVGCNARLNADGSISDNKDTLDAEWLNNVNTGTYTSRLASTAYNVPAITSVTRPAGYDTDGDGMPDAWETATFGDLTRDGTLDFDGDGYTDLEEFLNLVDGAAPTNNIPVITLTGASTINLNNGDTYTELGATATDTQDGNLTGSIVTTGTVNTNIDGTYYKYYNVTDSGGASAVQVVRTIIVTTASGNVSYSLSEQEKASSKRVIKNKLIKN